MAVFLDYNPKICLEFWIVILKIGRSCAGQGFLLDLHYEKNLFMGNCNPGARFLHAEAANSLYGG